MKWAVNDRVVATDSFGNFTNEPGTVTGFDSNMFDMELVLVRLDNGSRRSTCFYERELILEPPQDKRSGD